MGIYPGGAHLPGQDFQLVCVSMRVDVAQLQPFQAAVARLYISLK